MSNLEEAVKDAGVVFVMTDHAVYRALSPEKLSSMADRIVADGRRMLHENTFAEVGFTVIPLGASIMSAQAN